jgi:hypothetical protein
MKTLSVALYCVLGGLAFTVSAAGAGHFGWYWLSGTILAAASLPLALFGPRKILAQFATILLPLFVVGVLCTVAEAVVFMPGQKEAAGRNLAIGFALYLIASLLLALLIATLKLSAPSGVVPHVRPPGVAAILVVVSGIAYLVYYVIFGGIAYQFFTKQYYPQVQSLAMSLGIRLWLIELSRGLLMTLAVLPAIYTLRMPRWAAAISVGILLWIFGGGAQLLVPNSFMVPAQRYIHIVEILTQNAALGITAVLLLRRARGKEASV